MDTGDYAQGKGQSTGQLDAVSLYGTSESISLLVLVRRFRGKTKNRRDAVVIEDLLALAAGLSSPTSPQQHYIRL